MNRFLLKLLVGDWFSTTDEYHRSSSRELRWRTVKRLFKLELHGAQAWSSSSLWEFRRGPFNEGLNDTGNDFQFRKQRNGCVDCVKSRRRWSITNGNLAWARKRWAAAFGPAMFGTVLGAVFLAIRAVCCSNSSKTRARIWAISALFVFMYLLLIEGSNRRLW